MSPADAAIVGFAGWRIASLLVHEDGPGMIFERLRRLLGVPDEGDVSGFLPALLTCMLCATVWTTALVLVVVLFFGMTFALVLGAMGVAAWLSERHR